jgi:hypothetical protein
VRDGYQQDVLVLAATLHPSELPLNPQPRTVEPALRATQTDWLAVMWDTFQPLRLSTL